MKTLQEIFDQVATHLLTQNERAVGALGNCRYRTDTGLKCAIGCLIADEHYNSGCEGIDVSGAYIKPHPRGLSLGQALRNSGIDGKDQRVLRLLGRLQGVHDHNPVVSWHDNLVRVADDFGLSFPGSPGGDVGQSRKIIDARELKETTS